METFKEGVEKVKVKATSEIIEVKCVGVDEDLPFVCLYKDIKTGKVYQDYDLSFNTNEQNLNGLYCSLSDVNAVLTDCVDRKAITQEIKNFVIERLMENICPF